MEAPIQNEAIETPNVSRAELAAFVEANGGEVVEPSAEYEEAKKEAVAKSTPITDDAEMTQEEMDAYIQAALGKRGFKGRAQRLRGPGNTRANFKKQKARAKAKKARRANRR